MKNLVQRASALELWNTRLARAHERLMSVVDVVAPSEREWAPDDGIESAREHLWAVAESARQLTARLTRNRASESESFGCFDVAFEEIVRTLDICHRNLSEWMSSSPDEDALLEINTDDGTCLEDLVFGHLTLAAERRAMIAALVRLIDPRRRLPA